MRPAPGNPDIPHVAALCIYPRLVPVAVEALRGSGVKVASVASGFPSGQASLEARVEEVRQAVTNGADEIDIVRRCEPKVLRGNVLVQLHID